MNKNQEHSQVLYKNDVTYDSPSGRDPQFVYILQNKKEQQPKGSAGQGTSRAFLSVSRQSERINGRISAFISLKTGCNSDTKQAPDVLLAAY
ncbi:hypothetical protein WA026_003130 [Henosepilachna vigintioctopunctata]|uniref:Uncharacterized protein n=1 Tax=Henosepilachna vigintioctopunctata TaxID=420089 RepID=A0AAW1TM42_9CUCU